MGPALYENRDTREDAVNGNLTFDDSQRKDVNGGPTIEKIIHDFVDNGASSIHAQCNNGFCKQNGICLIRSGKC